MLTLLLEQLAQTSWVEWLGMATGSAGVWLSIKQKNSAWLLFIACYCCYIYIGWQLSLYAFAGMNTAFIGISLYGLFKWTRPQVTNQVQPLAVSNTPKHLWPVIIAFLLLGTLGIGYLLQSLGEASLPYLDAFATSCGFVAQWMLSRKHVENWLCWIISDIIYVCLFAMNNSIPSIILFTVLIGLACKGWRDWNKELQHGASILHGRKPVAAQQTTSQHTLNKLP